VNGAADQRDVLVADLRGRLQGFRDPSAPMRDQRAVKEERRMLYRRSYVLVSRIQLEEAYAGRHHPEEQIRWSAEFLSEWGARMDVDLLRRAERGGYADRLERRLGEHDPLRPGQHYPERMPGAEALCKLWFDLHRGDLAAPPYYPGRWVAVTWEGVVAVGDSAEEVHREVDVIRRAHGDFPCHVDRLDVGALGLKKYDDVVRIPPSVLEKLEPPLRAKLRRTPPSQELRIYAHLREDAGAWDEDMDAPEIDEADPDEHTRATIRRHRERMARLYGGVLRAIDATGVKRLGGENFATVVLQGTPEQIVRALEVDGVEQAFMDRPMPLL
jgi:hypothetical protein